MSVTIAATNITARRNNVFGHLFCSLPRIFTKAQQKHARTSTHPLMLAHAHESACTFTRSFCSFLSSTDKRRDGAGRTLRTPGRRTITRARFSQSGVQNFQSYAMEKMLHGRSTVCLHMMYFANIFMCFATNLPNTPLFVCEHKRQYVSIFVTVIHVKPGCVFITRPIRKFNDSIMRIYKI